MPVPASGPLQLRGDIALEVNGDATGTDVSLGALSNTAGFTEPDTMSEFYDFSMVSAPTVQTDTPTSISSSGMTLNGNVTADGGASVTSKGFYFGTDANYANNNKRSSVGSGTGAFNEAITGLSHSTVYYATAYAINSEGEGRGATVSQSTGAFTTPTVTQATTANVTDNFMDIYGTMQSPDGGNLQYGWYFGTSSTMTNNTFLHDGNTNGSTSTINFHFAKGSLSGSTTYYIWTAVRQLDGTVLASASVKTQQTLATLNYTTYQAGFSSVSLRAEAYIGAYCETQIYNQYNHQYYGYTTNGSLSRSGTAPSNGQYDSGTVNGRWTATFLSGGSATNNRTYGYSKVTNVNLSSTYGQGQVYMNQGHTSISGSSHYVGGNPTAVSITHQSPSSASQGSLNFGRIGWASNTPIQNWQRLELGMSDNYNVTAQWGIYIQYVA